MAVLRNRLARGASLAGRISEVVDQIRDLLPPHEEVREKGSGNLIEPEWVTASFLIHALCNLLRENQAEIGSLVDKTVAPLIRTTMRGRPRGAGPWSEWDD